MEILLFFLRDHTISTCLLICKSGFHQSTTQHFTDVRYPNLKSKQDATALGPAKDATMKVNSGKVCLFFLGVTTGFSLS